MSGLSRAQFNEACIALSQGPATEALLSSDRLHLENGWRWTQHLVQTDYGYLAKQVTRRLHKERTHDTCKPIDDDVTLATAAQTLWIKVELSIAYAATFCVPALFFSAIDNSGSPVKLEDLLASTLFKKRVNIDYPLVREEWTDSWQVPPITSGEHPITGRPCFYLHPCGTLEFVEELLEDASLSIEKRSISFLRAWLNMTNDLIDLASAP